MQLPKCREDDDGEEFEMASDSNEDLHVKEEDEEVEDEDPPMENEDLPMEKEETRTCSGGMTRKPNRFADYHMY